MAYDYGDFVLTWESRSFARHHPVEGTTGGVAFHGSDATLVVDAERWRVYPEVGGTGLGEEAAGRGLSGTRERNFLDCVKSRQRANADIEIGRLSTTICHLGNVCTRLRRDITFDPKTETFDHDPTANASLTKEHRKPYTLPKV